MRMVQQLLVPFRLMDNNFLLDKNHGMAVLKALLHQMVTTTMKTSELVTNQTRTIKGVTHFDENG